MRVNTHENNNILHLAASKTVLKTFWMIFGSSHLVSSSPQISQSTGITSQQLVGIRKYSNSQGLEQLDFHAPCVTFIVISMVRIRSDTGPRYEIELGQMPHQLGQNPPLTNPSR